MRARVPPIPESAPPPLKILAAALVAGTLFGLAAPVAAVACSLAIAAAAVLVASRSERRPRGRLALVLVAAALLLGALRGATATPPPAPPGFRETPVLLRAVAEDAPDVRRDAGGGRSAILRARLGDGRRVAVVRVRLSADAPAPPIVAGDHLRIAGRASAPRAPSNPGQRDLRAARRRDGVVLGISAPTSGAVLIERAGGAGTSLLHRVRRAGSRGRSWLLRRLRGAVGARPGTDAVLSALLVGDRSRLADDVRDDFRRAGAAHLLAVSGLHVVLLIGGLSTLIAGVGARLFPGRLGRLSALAAALAALLAYAAICRLATPVVRAAAFVAIAVIARQLGRRTRTSDHIAAAAALVVAADPAQVLTPGFHMSFCAVLGLSVLTPRFREALFARWDLLARFPEAVPRWRLRLNAWLAAGVSASLAASCATAPVTAAVFGELHPAAPLANLVAVPLVALLLPAAAFAALLGSAVEPVAGPLLWAGVEALAKTLAGIAALPGATAATGTLPVWTITASGLLLVAGALITPWRPRHLALPAAALALLVLTPGEHVAAATRGGPSVVALDVGHGVAVLLRGGEGGAVLYDAGGRMPGTAERVVVPALRALGVSRLAAVVISHEDSDHSGAVPDLLARVAVGVVLVPAGFGGAPAGRRVLAACARYAVPVVRLGRGDTWAVRDIALRALHPRRGAAAPAENEGSLVLHAALGRRASYGVLLPGDVEGTTLDTLAADRTLPRADVLLLPHHGRGPPAPHERLARRCGARHLVASTPATVPTGVAGALVTGRMGAILLAPGRAPLRLRP